MKLYLLTTAVISLGVCLTVGLFNYVIDPYAIYHYKGAAPEKISRIDQVFYMRITKPWQVRQASPTEVVIGTSRAARVSSQTVWDKKDSYNLSVPGMTVYEMSRFIEHANANEHLSKLMIGLDFEAFISPDPRVRPGFNERRLARDTDDLTTLRYIWQIGVDAAETLLSLPSLALSLSAVFGTAIVPRIYYDDGTWKSNAANLKARGAFVYVGKTTVFDRRNESMEMNINFEILANTLRFAHTQDIETRLFVTPEHIFMIDLWERLGFGGLWREFHRRLVAVNNAVAIEMGADPFPIFVFNAESGIVDEPIYMAKNAGQSWFEDGAHFRKRLGDKIMEATWTERDAFGARLDDHSVEAYLVDVEKIRHDFMASNAELTARLRRAISPDLE